MFTGIGLIAFCCIFGAGLLGFLLRNVLPAAHRSEETHKAVLTTMNVVAILAALVLGLMVASTKSNFDTRSREIETFSANLTLLDGELTHFGDEGKAIRTQLRAFTAQKLAQTWPSSRSLTPMMDEAHTTQMLDAIEDRIRDLTPQSTIQYFARRSALHFVTDLKRTGRLLAVQQSDVTPRPFLVVVIFWLAMLFLAYALFAPLNATVVAALIVAAFSVSIAVNLIYDMDHPFAGFVRVSPASMEQALEKMEP
jgi:Protein of unknown function (DUF4239)